MAAKEGLNFLDLLPLEIRDKIYRLVLAPTGYVAIDRVLPPSVDDDDDSQETSTSDHSIKIWQHGSPSNKFKVFFDYPFGLHTLKSFHPQNVRLSFLRTNRQIYQEAKHIFFRYNTLNIDARYDFESPYGLEFNIPQLPETLWKQLEKVHCIFLFNWDHQNSVHSALAPNVQLLKTLEDIASRGKLRAVDLNVVVSHGYFGFSPVSNFQDLMMFRQPAFEDLSLDRIEHNIYTQQVNLLRESRKKFLKDVQRRIFFDFSDVTGYQLTRYSHMPTAFVPVRGFADVAGNLTLFSEEGLDVHIHWKDTIRRSCGDPNVVFQELNNAFGGDLYLGSRLCFRDGTKISRPWHEIRVPWPSEEGEDLTEEIMTTFFILLRHIGEEWYEEEHPLFPPASPSPPPTHSRLPNPHSDHQSP